MIISILIIETWIIHIEDENRMYIDIADEDVSNRDVI